ncbi:MAG: hypothetical protein D6690_00475 [Nitrospirae bacterium]|nr:MAG: hypothetical protein D6690_00475 [Nitrospirota bacterium]
MLHRLTLRVLPQLHRLVTDDSVRRRKRWIMVVPGLAAFLLYRILGHVVSLSEPFVLLAWSGTVSALAAIWAYSMGREVSMVSALRNGQHAELGWIVGWIGLAYGIQLSLLVLALLKVFVNYDFFVHPDGPAMMAMIIACTSVTRDAFEIGCIRRAAHQGIAIHTFPSGRAFRQWLRIEPMLLRRWVGMAALVGGGAAALVWLVLGKGSQSEWAHVLVTSVLVASLGYIGFFAGESRRGDWWTGVRNTGWWRGIRFWIWPCFTFAVTYYLVLVGLVGYVLRVHVVALPIRIAMAVITAMLLVGYSVFLGRRTLFEVQAERGIEESVRQCPFVMGILEKTRATTGSVRMRSWSTLFGGDSRFSR